MSATTMMDGPVDPSPYTLFERGRSLFEAGDAEGALACLRVAQEADAHNARIQSYYGMCLGLVDRRFEEAVDLCQSAAKREFFNPDLYLNLARLYLGFGFKSEAIRYLRRGQMIDPANSAIELNLRQLGDRLPPVLRFLPRRHVLNRWLGTARYAIFRRRFWGVAA